ncbi:hypothetical protein PSHT_11937 [Puccinia striiformis]|uniref:Uncharacterized protein n=2 Tax=Puccinia striiformis TaxID=27350 RepID=A0A2S4W3G3_9BASI|nr:hypothetical protein Pst134EB_004350 [Puccinia striiformis f. sp. tritici]POW02815.1 hypothetical protein PSHT_11937 [Puccinia striiformis]POW16276.1 hypothetical protein PSTT_01470 [Puccinia striiformis]
MNFTKFTDNVLAEADCLVFTEEKPAIIRTSSREKCGIALDEKAQMLGYYSSLLSPIPEDLPPKYDSRDRRGQPQIFNSLLHGIRFIFLDHLLLKVLTVYLLMIYATGKTPLFASSDWSTDDDLLRSHSRDFLSVDIYELYDDSDSWSRGRLGRVGSDSPLLTYSEIELVGQVQWEVEPENLDDTLAVTSAEAQSPSPPKVQNKAPLPFRRPTNDFNRARQLKNQAQHGSTQKRDSRTSHPRSATATPDAQE